MKRDQPLADTINLLTGRHVPRSERPGERFETRQVRRRQRRSRQSWAIRAARLLLGL